MSVSPRLPRRSSRVTHRVASVLTLLLLVAGAPLAAHANDPWIGRDKALHFSVSFAIGSGGYGASSLVFENPRYRFLSGLGLALVVGGAKEISDASNGHGSWKDMSYDAAGAMAGALLAWGIDRMFFQDRRDRGPRPAPAADAVPAEDAAPREGPDAAPAAASP